MRRWALFVCLLAATASSGFDASPSPSQQVLSFDQQSFADSDATQDNPDDPYPAVFPLLTNPSGNGFEKQFIWNSTRDLYISTVTLYANLSSSSTPIEVKQWINPSGTIAGGSGSSTSGGSMSYTSITSATGIVVSGQVGGGDTNPQMSTPMVQLLPVSASSSSPGPIEPGVRHRRESRLVAADHQEFSATLNLNAQPATNGGSGIVTIEHIGDAGNDQIWGVALYLAVNWGQPGTTTTGTSTSRHFVFSPTSAASCPSTSDVKFCDLLDKYANDFSPAVPETVLSAASNVNPTSPTLALPSGFRTPTPVSTAGDGSGGTTGVSSMTSSSGGLSTGAIVGIAVGCGFAVLLVLAILGCFLIRRHRRQQAVEPLRYGHQNNRTQELIAEKEANAGTHEVPHSPYSDDGMHGNERFVTAEGAAVAHGGSVSRSAPMPNGAGYHQSRSFTAQSDHRSSTHTGAAVGETASTDDQQRHSVVQSSTPRAMSGRYAHLIEEGMTEDEIKRMEEEERHLDAAIEQAGRSS